MWLIRILKSYKKKKRYERIEKNQGRKMCLLGTLFFTLFFITRIATAFFTSPIWQVIAIIAIIFISLAILFSLASIIIYKKEYKDEIPIEESGNFLIAQIVLVVSILIVIIGIIISIIGTD